MPSAQVNTLNCLVLQSKTALKLIPGHMQIYFINSKRRFFLYFRSHAQMLQAMRVLADNAVKFYPRASLLPDREELEEQVFHCGYRYKKIDLRRNLLPGTPYNEPRLHFDRIQRQKSRQELHESQSPSKNVAFEEKVEEKKEEEKKEDEGIVIGGHKFRNIQAARVLMNKELLNAVLFSLNFPPSSPL